MRAQRFGHLHVRAQAPHCLQRALRGVTFGETVDALAERASDYTQLLGTTDRTPFEHVRQHQPDQSTVRHVRQVAEHFGVGMHVRQAAEWKGGPDHRGSAEHCRASFEVVAVGIRLGQIAANRFNRLEQQRIRIRVDA